MFAEGLTHVARVRRAGCRARGGRARQRAGGGVGGESTCFFGVFLPRFQAANFSDEALHLSYHSGKIGEGVVSNSRFAPERTGP